MGTIYFLEGVGVVACVPGLGRDGHRRRREVLHLFEMEIQFLGDFSQLLHVGFGASGMAGDEVGDELLVEVLLLIDAVEDALEVVELLERGLAHTQQHTVAGVFGGYLQSATDMMRDEFAGILHGGVIGGFVLAVMQDEVVAHTTADKAFLDTRQRIDGAIDVEQRTVVGVKVRTYLRMDATGSLALLASLDVAPFHAVHVGRGSTEVGEIATEIGHLGDLLHLF